MTKTDFVIIECLNSPNWRIRRKILVEQFRRNIMSKTDSFPVVGSSLCLQLSKSFRDRNFLGNIALGFGRRAKFYKNYKILLKRREMESKCTIIFLFYLGAEAAVLLILKYWEPLGYSHLKCRSPIVKTSSWKR